MFLRLFTSDKIIDLNIWKKPFSLNTLSFSVLDVFYVDERRGSKSHFFDMSLKKKLHEAIIDVSGFSWPTLLIENSVLFTSSFLYVACKDKKIKLKASTFQFKKYFFFVIS